MVRLAHFASLSRPELFATALLFLRVWAVSRRSKIVGAIFAFLLTVQTVCGARSRLDAADAADIVIAIAGLKPIPTFSLDGKQWCIAGGGKSITQERG